MDNLIKAINSVAEFHEVFQIGNENTPTISNSKTYELRHRLAAEENDEYLDACKKGDMVEIADALGDQLYILCGTILKHGLQDKIQDIFDEIHRSNMSKLDAQGQPIFREDGKILKSDLYFKPNIQAVLSNKKLTLNSILIAKDVCRMDNGGIEALILNKEYKIVDFTSECFIIKSEFCDIHEFPINDWSEFFIIK